MQSVTSEQLLEIADLLASLSDVEVEARALQVLGQPMLARRAVDWLPEAFGLVLARHLAEVVLPTTFKARDRSGAWVEIPLSRDPIFGEALKLAIHTYHEGPRELFANLATRSSVVGVVSQALNSGADLDGAQLSPLCMLGLPAEQYAA
jgi:hypothetical protein